ncbi:MAG: hypothetical protein V2I41_05755, partial [Pseudomonadales bacterium]|nr:hypothetical protein [Pseudomonadales bacterium]
MQTQPGNILRRNNPVTVASRLLTFRLRGSVFIIAHDAIATGTGMNSDLMCPPGVQRRLQTC